MKSSQILVIFLLFALPFSLPVTLPLRWSLGTFLILSANFCFFGRRAALEQLGLIAPRRHLLSALALFAALGFLSWDLIESLSQSQRWFNAVDLPYDWSRWIASFFQVLNEEIVLRAFLLCQLSRLVRSDLIATSIQTTINVLGHYLAALFVFGEIFSGLALISIVLFNFGANLLFLRLHHVMFSLAAHAAWNIIRHGSYRTVINPNTTDVILVKESAEYPVFEGSTQLVVAGAVFLFCSIAVYLRSSVRKVEAERPPSRR